MSVKFQAGAQVRQVLPAPVEGAVARFVFDETVGEVLYVVARTDADGHVHESIFRESEIEAVPAEG